MSEYMHLTLSMETVCKIADELAQRSKKLKNPQKKQFCRDMSIALRQEIIKALSPIPMNRVKKNAQKT